MILVVLELCGAPMRGSGAQIGVPELIWGFRSSYGGYGVPELLRGRRAHMGFQSAHGVPELI